MTVRAFGGAARGINNTLRHPRKNIEDNRTLLSMRIVLLRRVMYC